jgi:hypothetical protein
MQKPTCQQLRLKLAEIKTLKQEFDLELGRMGRETDKKQIRKFREELKDRIENFKDFLTPEEIIATFINPENNQSKEIKFNFQKQVKTWLDFYLKHSLPIPNYRELRSIWRKNHKEIKKEMETYGYDKILIIPENLPATEELHTQMSQGYAATYQGDNFKNAGSFAGAKHTETQKTRIILCHNDQNTYQNPQANFFAKQTLGKNILQLSGLTEAQLNTKIQNQENIPVDFETQINNQKIQIQAEGLSLNEYLILQRQYFQENQKHLDEKGWTWVLKTSSASRVADAHWSPGVSQLYVDADDLGCSIGGLGCRLSRSFSL